MLTKAERQRLKKYLAQLEALENIVVQGGDQHRPGVELNLQLFSDQELEGVFRMLNDGVRRGVQPRIDQLNVQIAELLAKADLTPPEPPAPAGPKMPWHTTPERKDP